MSAQCQKPRIIPVLDVMGGVVVRAIGGRREEYRPIVSRLTDSTAPVEVANALLAATGAAEFYVADLDAIRFGIPAPSVDELLDRVACEVLLDRGGVLPPFVLVGHSFGGLVARVFARRYRPDMAGLVLVDPAHPEDWAAPAPKERLKIDRGIALCRYGARAARVGIARVVTLLLSLGAYGVARAIVHVVSRGGLSREDELAADAFGVRTAGAAGYDPSGLRRFVEAISKTPSEKRSLLSKTHPDAADRIEAMDEEIGEIPAADRGTVTAADRFRTRSEGATGPGR